MSRVLALLLARRGAAATEYALVLALVVVASIAALTALGGALEERLRAIIEQIQG